ncbi:MAG TPA: FUSC family protein, partial [Dokdonella sp.]
MNLPGWRDWLYSAKAFTAAMLALYVALALSLPNPYWSMATVYIVSHPLSGATRSKAIYRAGGTFLGAAAAVAMVPPLVQTREVLALVMAAWTGSMLYLALLDRTPRGYTFMLAAYTTPLIGMPAFAQPLAIFDLALARTEEILLGIVCASVVSAVVFPSRIAAVLGPRMAAMLGDAASWAATVMRGRANAAPPDARNRLLADVVGMDALVRQLSYDASSRRQAEHARQMQRRLTMLIPQVSALADPLYALDAHAGGVPAELAGLVGETVAWMRRGADAPVDASDRLRAAAERVEAALPAVWRAPQVLISNALVRLREVVELWQDCTVLQRAYVRAESGEAEPLRYRARVPAGRARHYDHLLLGASAFAAAAAMFVGTLLWIELGWTDGTSAVVLAAVACCFFAAVDDPAPLL